MLKIGMMGLVVNNGNMGCVALTYSMIQLLEEISSSICIPFEYHIFEFSGDPNRIYKMSEELNIHPNYIKSVKYSKSFRMIKNFRDCDVFIDCTEGDSFADIYGTKQYIKMSLLKTLVIKLHIPLILAPQTYGPYLKWPNRKIAAYIINRCTKIFTRDSISLSCLSSLSKKNVELVTDVAFTLNYNSDYIIPDGDGALKIGIDVSKMLYFNEYDQTRLQLKTNFKDYIHKLMDNLSLMPSAKVYLISHVKGDYIANTEVNNHYTNSVLVPAFNSPIEAKSCISKLDIMISPRMHAAIAAASAGIAVLPVSYSRKFKGLFADIGLNNFVDLENYSTEYAVQYTLHILKESTDSIRLNKSQKSKIDSVINEFKISLQDTLCSFIP